MKPHMQSSGGFVRGMARLPAFMAPVIVGMALGLLAAGCVTAPPSSTPSTTSASPTTEPGAPDPLPAGVSIDPSPWGQVLQVHESLRYVVMEFPSWQMPGDNEQLGIYRNGRRVGIVRITGPRRGTTIAGDLIQGNAAVGDAVHLD